MFNINAAALPTLRTRQALLILDLQNEFLSPDGNLTVNQPDGLVSRITNLAKAFRLSGAGDVVWIRSRFDVHRPLSEGADGGDQIITTDAPVVPRRTTSGRGRPPTSGRHEEAVMEADGEAFLSYPPTSEKPRCVQKDSKGAELGSAVQAAVDGGRDIIFTKTHYSAFAAGEHQLVQMLRGRFVTEIYLCGALTNISIYATALDAGRHGYDITLVDDCCGYRSDMRHSNAVHRLVNLTGCEVTTSSDVIAKLTPERPSSKHKRRSRGTESVPNMLIPVSNHNNNNREAALKRSRSRSRSRKPALGQPSPQDEDDVSQALPSSLEKLTLSGDDSSTAPAAPPPPSGSIRVRPPQDASEAAQQPFPAMVTQAQTQYPTNNTATPPAAPVATVRHQTTYVDSAPLEVDPDLSAGPMSPGDSVDDLSRRMEQFDIAQKLSYIRSNVRGPPRVRIPPNSSLAAGTAARSAAAKAKLRSRQPVTPQPDDASGSTEPKDTKLPTRSDASGLADPKDTTPAAQSSAPTPAMDEPSHPTPTTSPPLCEGDTTIISNLLPPSLADNAFTLLNAEVQWARMSHQGGSVPRLVAVQGHISPDGSFPAYRHPSDESPPLLPFSPTVLAIKSEVEKQVGHPLNHVLIQFYRDGNDYISEHSDKTLDIVKGSYIANVSLGAERTMVFRTKRGGDKDPSRNKQTPTPTTPTPETEPTHPPQPRRTERAPLPHNSLVRMGLATNRKWLHSIRADKRLDRDKSAAELAYSGQRISLTFRHIGTFLNKPQTHIWGQGATSKTKDTCRPVINGQTAEAVKMLQAFGTENHASSDFDWEAVYGAGFDVLHIKAAARLFASADGVVNMSLALQLADLGLGVAKGSTGAVGLGSKEASVRFVDNDEAKSTVEGWMAVMLYLDAVYGGGERRNQPPVAQDELARRLTRFQAATGLLDRWRGYLAAAAADAEGGQKERKDEEGKKLRREMEVWDGYAAAANENGKGYIAGGQRASIADFAFWPVLHDIMLVQRDVVRHCRHLEGYYERVKGRKAAVKVLGGSGVEAREKGESSAAPTASEES